MGLFGFGKKKVVSSEEALEKISSLVSERDFQKLQNKLKGVGDVSYKNILKSWAIDHEDPEVNKIGRML